MSKIEELEQKFGVNGVIRVEAGRGSLPRIAINTELATAEIYLHGAHVTHFQPRGAAPVLFMSKNSLFDERKPIRGGIPLVFPWFGPRADLPDKPPHGFARTRGWQIESCDARSEGSVRIVMGLASDDATLLQWPNAFSMRLFVIVSKVLEMTLEVRNTSNKAVRFEEAMHSYFAVGDLAQVAIEGLGGSDYLDRVDGEKRKKQSAEPIRITGETDRVYFGAASPVVIRDGALKRTIIVEKERSDATVIWNPWSEKGKAMADLGADQWQTMVCVETANARECAVNLPANGIHRMTTRIGVGA